jgi:sugar phosphate isomerase/epimerase
MLLIGGRAHTIENIHAVGALGYPFIEFSLNDPDVVERQAEEILGLKQQYNIELIGHYPNENNPVDIKVLRDKFFPKMKRLFSLSQVLGVKKSTLHFWIDKRWAPEKLLPEKIELLSEMVEEASLRGVTLCIENLSERCESFETAFEAIPKLKMTLDIGHGQLLSKENTSFGFIADCFDRIDHIHVHDNHGGTRVEDDLHLCLGDGVVKYQEIFSLLKKKNYQSTITMEVKPGDMPRTRAEIERYLL